MSWCPAAPAYTVQDAQNQETGAIEKAKRLAEKALTKLVPNPYVEYYRMKILG